MNEEIVSQPDEIRQDRNINNGGMRDNIPGGGMDASELVQSLLSNEHIPEKLRKKCWILFSQTIKLSFINDSEANWFMQNWELLRLTIIEAIPKSEYNEELEEDLIMIGMEFKGNLMRAKGAKMNERELLGSSTSATFSERNMSHGSDSPGFLDKLTNMFR